MSHRHNFNYPNIHVRTHAQNMAAQEAKNQDYYAGMTGHRMPPNGNYSHFHLGQNTIPKFDSATSTPDISFKSYKDVFKDHMRHLINKLKTNTRMIRPYVDQADEYNETKAIFEELYPDHDHSWNKQTLSDFIIDEVNSGGLHLKLIRTTHDMRVNFKSWYVQLKKFTKKWNKVLSHHDKLREKFQRYNDSGALKAFLDTGDNLQNARIIFDKLFSPKGQRGNRIMRMNSDQMITAMGKSLRRNSVVYKLFHTDQVTRDLFTTFSSDLLTSCKRYHLKMPMVHLRDAISILGKNIAKPFKFIGLGNKLSKPDVTSATCAFAGHESLVQKPSLFTRLRKGIKRMVNVCQLSRDDPSFNAKSNDQTNRNTKRSKYPIFKGLKIAVLSIIAIAPASTTNTPILSTPSESDQGTNVAPQAKPTMADDTASFTHYVATQNGALNMRAEPNTNAPIVQRLGKDVCVTSAPSATKEWATVMDRNDPIGYVSDTYIKPIGQGHICPN